MIMPFKNTHPQLHESVFVAEGAQVIGDVQVGKDASLWFNAVLRGDVAPIRIGQATNVQDGCVLHCLTDVSLVVGDRVTIGHGAILHSCQIGNDCLIGMGAIILDRAQIGNHCVIGAGALVTPGTVVPDGSLVLGSPARVIKTITEADKAKLAANIDDYRTLAATYQANPKQ